MPNYNDAKIYKIIDNTNGNIYIGSTYKTLDKRLKQHKWDYNKFINGKKHFVTSYKIIENNDYIIELIELFPCNNKKELYSREGYHIRNTECVNKCMSILETKKEYNQKYLESNRDKISQQRKQYREANKEKIAQQNKEWREANRDKISQQRKEHYEANREKILQQRKEWRESKKV